MNNLIAHTKNYCLQLLKENIADSLCFHNVEHTLQVYENVKVIGAHEQVAPKQMEFLMLAALFHDVGHIKTYKGHEIFSANMARTYLEGIAYPEKYIQEVERIIKATQMPQQPTDLLEQIICDADLFHLGTEDFLTRNSALRKEWEVIFNKYFTDPQWQALNEDFLNCHKYHTSYCKVNLAPGKQKNREALKNCCSL
ncbi:HD domain-containing protein [Pustulibacterium marinum]|uniref:HD domain-containing protein n=1 Tax=Pustulibacterium marinum TaxID=1224947 RepID=A0A1I7GA16_9FLAO|nr:HD domain-containing protein [Pustulibacterium marinum]SFU45294.1 HD domain-containing protein [Pustulibacterium marinum]